MPPVHYFFRYLNLHKRVKKNLKLCAHLRLIQVTSILSNFAISVAALGVISILVWIIHSKQNRVRREVPRPKSALPILDNTLDFMYFHPYRVHDWILNTTKNLGLKI